MPIHPSPNWRQLIYLALLALAVFFLLPHFIGFEKILQIVLNANPIFLTFALCAETSRYFTSAGSTISLARLFQRKVPLFSMTEAFFGGASLNRTFSTGGAPGMLVRLIFLAKHSVSAGSVAAIFLIEDLIGLLIGGGVVLIGLVTLLNTQPDALATDLAASFVIGSILLGLASLYIFRNRSGVEKIIHGLARAIDKLLKRFFNRSAYDAVRLQHALDDFYLGLAAARQAPRFVVASFLFNVLRYIGGALTLYFTFHALNQTIAPGVLILLYTTASLLSTTSAVPGEVAIMGTGFAILFLALGLAPAVAVVALILSRALAFWLPMPIGLLALVHLRRKNEI